MNLQQYGSLALKTSPELGTQDGSPESPLLESVALARAMLLARRGKLAQAEALLLSLVERADSRPEALDLLAKVYAQQDKIEQAQATWLRALEQDPCNLHLLSALQLCAHYQRSRYRRVLLRRSGMLSLAIVAIAAVALAVLLTLYT